MNRNIPMGWSDERQELSPVTEARFSYFLRVEGRLEEKRLRLRQPLARPGLQSFREWMSLQSSQEK